MQDEREDLEMKTSSTDKCEAKTWCNKIMEVTWYK